jgi:hypothetical protein
MCCLFKKIYLHKELTHRYGLLVSAHLLDGEAAVSTRVILKMLTIVTTDPLFSANHIRVIGGVFITLSPNELYYLRNLF